MTCTERLQKWHARRSTADQKAASQIKLKHLRNLRGARTDIKQTRQKKKVQLRASSEYDYSGWYRRDVSKMGEEVKEKMGEEVKEKGESSFYGVLCKYKKESPLFLHLRYKPKHTGLES